MTSYFVCSNCGETFHKHIDQCPKCKVDGQYIEEMYYDRDEDEAEYDE